MAISFYLIWADGGVCPDEIGTGGGGSMGDVWVVLLRNRLAFFVTFLGNAKKVKRKKQLRRGGE